MSTLLAHPSPGGSTSIVVTRSDQIKTVLHRRSHAQSRKYLSYRKAWADLNIWSDHGLGSLDCTTRRASIIRDIQECWIVDNGLKVLTTTMFFLRV